MIDVSATRLAPWQARTHSRPWSLDDMLRFYAQYYWAVATFLEHAILVLVAKPNLSDKAARARVASEGKLLLRVMRGLPVSETLRAAARRLAEPHADLNIDAMRVAVENFQEDFRRELAQHVFFEVGLNRRQMFLKPEKWFGKRTTARYPDAKQDICDCVQCFALEQWTAAVFHAMRTTEYGLRDLAARLQVTFSVPAELQNWKNIIDLIEKEIKKQEQLPNSPKKAEDLKFYSTAATHFFHIKSAWRNYVSHTRESYDEHGAMRVIEHVRDFMAVLASRA